MTIVFHQEGPHGNLSCWLTKTENWGHCTTNCPHRDVESLANMATQKSEYCVKSTGVWGENNQSNHMI